MKRCSVPFCLLWLSLSVVAATAEPIRVSVGSDPAFTAFYYASQQKLFEKAGLDVRLSIVTQAGDAMDGLVAGQYDFVAGSESTTMVRAERASLKALGVFWQSASYIKLTADSGINSPTDIKTIGFVPGSASELSTLKLFTKYGIDPKSVKQLASPPPELPALLLRKDIDAFFLWEPWPSRAVKQGAGLLLTSGDVGYTSTMLAVVRGLAQGQSQQRHATDEGRRRSLRRDYKRSREGRSGHSIRNQNPGRRGSRVLEGDGVQGARFQQQRHRDV